jgi:hypothetical protein
VNGLKKLLGADDALDVFGVHGVGGIVGALLTGVFVSPGLGGTGVYDYVANKVGEFIMGAQIVSQLWGVGTAIVWSGVVSFVAFKIVDIDDRPARAGRGRARGPRHHLARGERLPLLTFALPRRSVTGAPVLPGRPFFMRCCGSGLWPR